MPHSVKAKKACCGSSPRCKRCPVVLRRLRRMGLAERRTKRVYLLSGPVSKKQMKVARVR